MTLARIREIFETRGYVVAMRTARACREKKLVEEVKCLLRRQTGCAMPVALYRRTGRKVAFVRWFDGHWTAAAKAHRESGKALANLPMMRPTRAVGNLTPEEQARRAQALLAA